MTIISPYLAEAARRASIQIVTLNAPIASVSYGHSVVPLERADPIQPAWKDWVAGFLIFVIFIGCLAMVT